MSQSMTWMIYFVILIGPWRRLQPCPQRLKTSLLIMLHKYWTVGKQYIRGPQADCSDVGINDHSVSV